MQLDLNIFKYQSDEEQQLAEITTVEIDGDIWFVATDICKTLGLSNTTEAIRGLDDDEKLTSELMRAGQMRKTNLINESGLYALIFKSRKPSAQKFRKWVTKEVIPSIRKKGYYGRIDRTQAPNFYLRYKENLHKIDRKHFSVISELFVTLNAELEKFGYQIPDKGEDGKGVYPDISVGMMFSKYLKKMNSPFANNPKYYKHTFPDSREDVDARMYPLEALPLFRTFVFEDWIPNRAMDYFRKKDPIALNYLPKLLGN